MIHNLLKINPFVSTKIRRFFYKLKSCTKIYPLQIIKRHLSGRYMYGKWEEKGRDIEMNI